MKPKVDEQDAEAVKQRMKSSIISLRMAPYYQGRCEINQHLLQKPSS